MIWVVWTFALMLAAFLLLMGWQGYPVPLMDSACFIPPAINLKIGLGLLSPLDLHVQGTDPTGGMRFLYYPPLFQYTLSLLMPRADAPSAIFALSVLSAVLIPLSVFLWRRVAMPGVIRWDEALVFSLSVAGLATFAVGGAGGRPEALAMPLAVLLALVLFWSRLPYQRFLAGVLLGLLGVTHPVGALLSVILLLLGLILRNPLVEVVKIALFVLGVAILEAAMVLATSPYSIPEYVSAISTQARNIALPDFVAAPSLYWHEFLVNPHATFYGVLVVAGLVFLALRLWKRGRQERWAGVSLLVLLGGLAWYFGVRIPYRSYNLFLFVPFCYLACLYCYRRTANRGVKGLIILLLFLSGTGFLRQALLFPVYLSQGVTLAEARRAYQTQALPIQQGKARKVYVSTSFWALSEDYQAMGLWYPGDQPIPQDAAMIVLQQSHRQTLQPPDLSGYRLVSHNFRGNRPRLLNVPLASSVPGYAFALYQSTNRPSNASGTDKER